MNANSLLKVIISHHTSKPCELVTSSKLVSGDVLLYTLQSYVSGFKCYHHHLTTWRGYYTDNLQYIYPTVSFESDKYIFIPQVQGRRPGIVYDVYIAAVKLEKI